MRTILVSPLAQKKTRQKAGQKARFERICHVIKRGRLLWFRRTTAIPARAALENITPP